jgi:hypothetical protein
MELKDLDKPIKKTVWIRRDGVLKCLQIPVQEIAAMKPHPMFPIERKSDGNQ